MKIYFPQKSIKTVILDLIISTKVQSANYIYFIGERVECLTNFLNYVSDVIACPRRDTKQDILELNEDVIMDPRTELPVTEWHSMNNLSELGKKVLVVLCEVIQCRKSGAAQVHLDIHKTRPRLAGGDEPVVENHDKDLLRNLISKFTDFEPLNKYGLLYNAVSILHPVVRYGVPIYILAYHITCCIVQS